MKLYFSPGACSLAPHITLHESGVVFDTEKVDLKTHQTEAGKDFYQISPKGYVPTLEISAGQLLTEGPAIQVYIAEQAPTMNLIPLNGFERYHTLEWLAFINTELHKVASPLFGKDISDDYRAKIQEKLFKRYEYINQWLENKSYLLGQDFTAPDAYLFTVTRWMPALKVDITSLAAVQQFMQTMRARPAVQKALEAEGIG